jgi:uncharacterized repeat protein (TIGR02543 family)
MTSSNKITIFCSLIVISGIFIISSCSAITGDDDENDQDEPTEYSLSVLTNPSDGGSVDPESGTYDEGEEMEVTATPADGWEFTGWTGDEESTDNPLTFEIISDTELTANFEEQPKAYINQLEISNGTNTQTLTFGMDEEATVGYDEGLDDEAPPAPPEGSFYAHMVIDDYNLFADYRPVVAERMEWEVHFGAEGENTITLNWEFNPDQYLGTLTLVDDPDDPSIEIDMDTESSYQVEDNSLNVLFIIQQ